MTTLSLLDQPPEDPEPAGTTCSRRPPGWPAPPAPAVYHELLGEIVTRIAPHTEADPVAILTQLLVAFGAAVGRGAFFEVEATRHHPNEFMLLVGDSSKARKGSSWDHVRRLIAQVDPAIERRILTGLSSGEGLIWAVRDPTAQDPGITDQRLLVIEPEFASVLKAASSRDLDALADAALRVGWPAARDPDPHRPGASDPGTHRPDRSHHPDRAASSHQHNRARQRLSEPHPDHRLPPPAPAARRRPPRPPPRHRPHPPARRDPQARPDRRADPPRPSRPRALARRLPPTRPPLPGVLGQITARAEAHTIRLALIYALADGKQQIGPQHLPPRSRSRTTPPAPRAGPWPARPASRSPNRSTPPSSPTRPA